MTSTFRSTALLACCLTALSLAAEAQTAAPAATAVQVPQIECQSPGFAPLDKAGSDMTRFSKRVDEYKICVNAYVKSTGAKSNEYADQARAYGDAANKAIEDYNAYITKLNESTKSDKSGTTKN